jgi:hypothetical protein
LRRCASDGRREWRIALPENDPGVADADLDLEVMAPAAPPGRGVADHPLAFDAPVTDLDDGIADPAGGTDLAECMGGSANDDVADSCVDRDLSTVDVDLGVADTDLELDTALQTAEGDVAETDLEVECDPRGQSQGPVFLESRIVGFRTHGQREMIVLLVGDQSSLLDVPLRLTHG